MSTPNKLQYHHEIRRHFHPCLELAAETEENLLLNEIDDISSSNTIISNTSVWNKINIFDDDEKFPAANLHSTLDDDDIKSLRDLFLIPDNFLIFKPRAVDRVYDLVSVKGCLGVGISVAAFECGFRVLMHPFLEEVLDTCDVGLGQLIPNSFLNINIFIARCFMRKIEPNIDIFWCHYKLTSTSKCAGFYSIERKNTLQKWSDTRTNNKGFYENWFFLVGPKIENYAQWSYYVSKVIPKKNSKLDPPASKIYKSLKTHHNKSMIISSSKIRSKTFLIEIKVSCIGMDETRVQQRHREQKLAKARLGQKKNSDKDRTQKYDVAEELQNEGTNDLSRAIEIVTDASFVEPDATPPPNKKKKNDVPKAPPKVPKHVLDSVSSSSITLGKSMSTSVTLHEVDEKKLSIMNSASHAEEVMALASQLLLWSCEEVAASKVELDQLSKLQNVANAAKNKVTVEQHKVAVIEAKLKKIEADAAAREDQLQEKNSTLKKQLQEAEQGKLNVEASWYGIGLDRILEMVKAANIDATKCMFGYELDILREEQANDALQNSNTETPILNVEDDVLPQENTGEN